MIKQKTMVIIKIAMIHATTKLQNLKGLRKNITTALRMIKSYKMKDHHLTQFPRNE